MTDTILRAERDELVRAAHDRDPAGEIGGEMAAQLAIAQRLREDIERATRLALADGLAPSMLVDVHLGLAAGTRLRQLGSTGRAFVQAGREIQGFGVELEMAGVNAAEAG